MYSLSHAFSSFRPLLCCFKVVNDNSRVISSDHNSHTFCYFCFVFWNVTVCGLWMGWSFFSLWHPVTSTLLVFAFASAFNSDVSNWNTGAVTNTYSSKCTLSPSRWPRLPLLCILNIRQLKIYRITILIHVRFIMFVLLFYFSF